MQAELAESLRARQPQIRERWAALLHVEPVTTPLAHPGALVHLLDWTLEELFSGLAALPVRRTARPAAYSRTHDECTCGRNPLLTYFSAGEQAVREALILAQAALPSLDPFERDASLAELDLVFHHIAHREIATFCSVCQHRGNPRPCPIHTLNSPATHASS